MSRIGNALIIIPTGVTVEKQDKKVVVSGPKGKLEMNLAPLINIEINEGTIKVLRKNDEKRVKSLHGLSRNLIANMIIGVTNGWSKSLELVGVGFRAEVINQALVLNVGYSHPVKIDETEGILFEVSDNTKIKVTGIDKQLVGQISANVKKVRVPDVYKGKGIRFEGEYIRKKVGKSAKVGVAGAK